jgi:hypothetical protein
MEAHAASTDVLSLGHDHFQLASSVVNITAKGFMHTTNCFFWQQKFKAKSQACCGGACGDTQSRELLY